MWHIELKDALERLTGLGQDALHVHVSIIVYLATMFALRRRWRSPVPWLIVFALEAANEALDLHYQWGVGVTSTWSEAFAGGWPEGLKDMVNTMMWPTVLLLVGRYSRLFRPPEERQPPPA
ncbi:MAG TPA: hypothetical protein VF718_03520 [Allosphingosinicella sp.]|jgi:hypothetical protein